MKLLAFVFAASSAFAQTASVCNEEFFRGFQAKAGLSLCQAARVPTCQVPQVAWDKDYKLNYYSLGVAGGTAFAESMEKFVVIQTQKTATFAAALESGTYLESKFYGYSIHEGVKYTYKRSLAANLGLWLSGAMAFTSVYFYEDSDPAKCNATLEGSYKTQGIPKNVCQDVIAMSSNVVKFISEPLTEQVKRAKEFPSVCEFYQKLDKKLEKDLEAHTQLVRYECDGEKVKSFTAGVGETNQRFQIKPVTQGAGTMIGMSAEAVEGVNERIVLRFKNRERSEQIIGTPGRVPDVMKAWYALAPVLSVCCSKDANKPSLCKAGQRATAIPAAPSAEAAD